ncbi:MAG TPA: hypothetical protein VMP08_08525, partial [Anaerolineae bacterium]|nr:hypothetical protein [Anaerolineae bacterium]
ILKQAADQGANTYFVLPDIEWLKTRVRRLARRLDVQTVDILARGIASLLNQFAFALGLRMEYVISTIEFERNGMARGEDLTLDFMMTTVRPYLSALEGLQHAADRIRGQILHTLTISGMETNPIRISFRGGFDAVPIVRDMITPWRLRNARDLARIANMPARIELFGTGVRSALRRARLEFLRAGLEIRRRQLAIEEFNLARIILEGIGLNLRNMTDEQIAARVQEILPAITAVMNSELLVAPN